MYPRSRDLAEVEHRTEKTRAWPAWAGTREDLGRIGAVTQGLFEFRKKSLCEAYQAGLENEIDDQINEDRQREGIRKQAEQFANSMRLEATVAHGTDSSTGQPDDVIKELDRRTVTSYTLESLFPYPTRDESLTVKFMWAHGDNSTGAEVKIGSKDIGWANQALAMLSEEIDKGGPKWFSVHKPAMRFAVHLLVTLSVAGSITFAFAPLLQGALAVIALAIVSVLFVAWLLVGVAVLAPFVYNTIFPPVELLGEDFHSTTGRRVAFFSSLVLTVALGVFVNIIS